MLTTELISIPTGFLFLVTLGTLWKAKIRFEPPMLFCLGMLFNFLIGGVTGVFLSDVPVNVTVHGSFFVLAHFHYTIMGGLIFALFGGLYFWLPKMTGKTMNRKLSLWHFWTFFIFFNLTFFPLFLVGLLGQPRRVFEYAQNLQTLERHLLDQRLLPGCVLLLLHHQLRLVDLHRIPARRPTTRGTRGVWSGRRPRRSPGTTSSGFRSCSTTPTTTASETPRRWPTWAGNWWAPAMSRANRWIPTTCPLVARDDLDPRPPIRVSAEAMPDRKRTERAEGFLHLNETPEEIAFELRAQEGALWTGGRLVIGIWSFALRRPGFRLLLPAFGQQRGPVAPGRDHRAHRAPAPPSSP